LKLSYISDIVTLVKKKIIFIVKLSL